MAFVMMKTTMKYVIGMVVTVVVKMWLLYSAKTVNVLKVSQTGLDIGADAKIVNIWFH